MTRRFFTILVATLMIAPAIAIACPRVEGYVDFNCDQKLKITVLGDSIVYGVRDNDNKGVGGYVLRLKKLFPDVEFANLGIPGITTDEMIRKLKSNLNSSKQNEFKTKLQSADIVMIDLGRNDYWEKVHSSYSMVNIRRIVGFIGEWFSQNRKLRPYIMVSTLLPVNTYSRSYQVPFIEALNKRILEADRMRQIRVVFRVDTLPESVLSYDGLHPNSAGYTTLTKFIEPKLNILLKSTLRVIRPDSDRDGVYDVAERYIFRTNATVPDTDGDGFSDGYELFTSKTSPRFASQHP